MADGFQDALQITQPGERCLGDNERKVCPGKCRNHRAADTGRTVDQDELQTFFLRVQPGLLFNQCYKLPEFSWPGKRLAW